ncbi:TPA: hypothetical protein ACPVZG_004133 [Vibrio parahaemolyticus]|uniref:hypothetical protein n=1 Tax=Vibrio parahaemolyticus TaxID=670 RepID=UPI0032AFA97C
MTSVNFSTDLLNIILAVKEKKTLAVTESMLGLCDDHFAATKEYFESLPHDLINKEGLKKNQYCFEAILNFPRERLELLSTMDSSKLHSQWFEY